MKDLKDFNIPFIGLKQGSHLFEYQISKKFFEAYNFDEFNDCDVQVTIDLAKKSTFLELDFNVKGSVNVPCDVTNELFDQEVKGDLHLIVKFGHEFNDDNDDVLIIPHEEYQINVSQYIYELIILSVPNKRVHPKVLDGTMESEALKRLEELRIKENNTAEEQDSTDPRWDKLKDLLTDK
ncbi:YceD family protein [Tenacibaculum xiamenense]|uniref:YceD family protein n=1 Tax=Tenacibaculum xiamenense TaxID=1261553 RepID=UPI0038953629